MVAEGSHHSVFMYFGKYVILLHTVLLTGNILLEVINYMGTAFVTMDSTATVIVRDNGFRPSLLRRYRPNWSVTKRRVIHLMNSKLSESSAKSKNFIYDHEPYGQILTLVDGQAGL
jgi:hypothetical protein